MLDAERIPAPEGSTSAPPEAPEAQPPAGALACGTCGAEMAPEQDWCLNCGAAAPGRLGDRSGWRAFSTIAVLTALLVLGAAAASFAALSSDKRKPAIATAPPAQVAQAAPPADDPAGRDAADHGSRGRGQEGPAAEGEGPEQHQRERRPGHAGQAAGDAEDEHPGHVGPALDPVDALELDDDHAEADDREADGAGGHQARPQRRQHV